MENYWHVTNVEMTVSYAKFDTAVDALREAIRLLRLCHPDAYGTELYYQAELYYQDNQADGGTLYYREPFLSILCLPVTATIASEPFDYPVKE